MKRMILDTTYVSCFMMALTRLRLSMQYDHSIMEAVGACMMGMTDGPLLDMMMFQNHGNSLEHILTLCVCAALVNRHF